MKAAKAQQHLSWPLPVGARGNDKGVVVEEEMPSFLSRSIKCETERLAQGKENSLL